MDINVRRFDKYCEMTVSGMDTKIESGTMDEEEAKAMAFKLVDAAKDLFPDCYERDALMEVADIL